MANQAGRIMANQPTNQPAAKIEKHAKRNRIFPILRKCLLKPFYRQNAGRFLFIFILFFGVVAPSQQLRYHYQLIMGILEVPLVQGLVFLVWMAYAAGSTRFIVRILGSPDHRFLGMIASLNARISFAWLLLVQFLLFLPVLLYAGAVTGLALYQGRYASASQVSGYNILLCLSGAAICQVHLRHPGRTSLTLKMPVWISGLAGRMTAGAYPVFLLRFLAGTQKLLFAGIKLFTCTLLYLQVRDQTPGLDADPVTGSSGNPLSGSGDSGTGYYDLRMPSLVFGLGIFGHGILIYRIRHLEESRMLFYRSLPVNLANRFWQYGLLYLVLFIPEILLIGWLTPGHLRWMDALGLLLSGYGTLLFLNSLLWMARVSIKTYLKILLALFGLLYYCVLAGALTEMAVMLLLASAVLFFRYYFRYPANFNR